MDRARRVRTDACGIRPAGLQELPGSTGSSRGNQSRVVGTSRFPAFGMMILKAAETLRSNILRQPSPRCSQGSKLTPKSLICECGRHEAPVDGEFIVMPSVFWACIKYTGKPKQVLQELQNQQSAGEPIRGDSPFRPQPTIPCNRIF